MESSCRNRLSDRLTRSVDGADRELRFGHIKAQGPSIRSDREGDQIGHGAIPGKELRVLVERENEPAWHGRLSCREQQPEEALESDILGAESPEALREAATRLLEEVIR